MSCRGGYDVPNVAKSLDFINLMAYDFHGKWESQAGHNAPLYAPSSDSQGRKQLSVSFAAQMWTRYIKLKAIPRSFETYETVICSLDHIEINYVIGTWS